MTSNFLNKNMGNFNVNWLPSLKLAAKARKFMVGSWKMIFCSGARPIFGGELLVLGGVKSVFSFGGSNILITKLFLRFLVHYIPTRFTPTSYKWGYNPYKCPCKWVSGVITYNLLNGVITILITGRVRPRRMSFITVEANQYLHMCRGFRKHVDYSCFSICLFTYNKTG